MYRTLKRIINWCGEYKKQLYLGFIFTVLSSWFSAAPIMIAAYTLGMIVKDARGIETFNTSWIIYSLLLVILFVLLRFLFDYLRAKKQEVIGYEMAAKDRIEVGDIMKRVPLGYFATKGTGDILNAITTGLEQLENMGIRMIDTMVGGYLNIAIMTIFLAFFSPLIAAIVLCGILLSLVFLKKVSRYGEKNGEVLLKTNDEISNAVIEYIRGLPVVKSFGQEGVSIKSLRKACNKSKKINVKIELNHVPNASMHKLMLDISSIGIIFAASYLKITGKMDFSTMIMFLLFSFYIFLGIKPISDSAHVMGIIDNALNSIEDIKNAKFVDQGGEDIKLNNYDIEFKNVTFGYDKRTILHNVSLKIPEHTTTAIVGPSGSGKSTICNLIARFYNINSGEILIGGQNINDFTCDSLLKNISMVFQNVYLFHDTIRKNIAFGRPEATDEEIKEAAKKARCHDFIMKLPNGYDTIIGEGGSSLSGGEKQRISIARAILKDSPVIILDEATASVDPENEHLIQEAISSLTKGKTIITIAHRLSTIQNANQILVVNDGKISERGTHEQLIKQPGIYRKFIEIRESAEGWKI
ncbi:ABC transporter ATP-binding protein [Clostridium sp. BJN0001]|uniref:ABC transporter ATP-binding protein n=1 Tax=Clostridium sp. BJN0001 TaxID=2930219 RepID=UPI001FD465C8|nr:ABC transporter ATP-binding protein [Clostridium sp. BJN0001]